MHIFSMDAPSLVPFTDEENSRVIDAEVDINSSYGEGAVDIVWILPVDVILYIRGHIVLKEK